MSRSCRIANRIGQRIVELEDVSATIDPSLRVQAEIELRALRLLPFQKQVPFRSRISSLIFLLCCFLAGGFVGFLSLFSCVRRFWR